MGLLQIWNEASARVFVKFQSMTGALIVLYAGGRPHAGEAFAHKLGDCWYWGRYTPIGFSRTPIADASSLEAMVLMEATEALARLKEV